MSVVKYRESHYVRVLDMYDQQDIPGVLWPLGPVLYFSFY